ncbi:hypothetical protein FRB98_002796 [Tulasnella sp. 332]|nr:hypothetical protein FRB98_002796 [Tulasnella sp. 332]
MYLCKWTRSKSCQTNHRVSGPDSEGGFNIQATTRNGALKAGIYQAPAGTHITFNGETTNADAQVILPPAFEGTIRASTTNSVASLNDKEYVDDPAKQGRKRDLSRTLVTLKAFVLTAWWGEAKDPKEHGESILTTTNGLATVILGSL